MKTVFQPLNEKVEDTIVKNSQLIVGKGIPKAFREIIAQTEAYKAILSGWKENEKIDPDSFEAYAKTVAPNLKYSDALSNCVADTFKSLKDRQEALERAIIYVGQESAKAPTECEN